MDKCDFELLLLRPLQESQGRLLSLMHAGHIAHSLHFALGGPVTDEATYRAQHGKNLRALENGKTVVTANKVVLANCWPELEAAARTEDWETDLSELPEL